MQRSRLLELLDAYQMTWARGVLPYISYDAEEEKAGLAQLSDFVRREPHCFERACAEGHITASALVTDPACEKVLLTLHAKLGKWLQLGGHVDGDPEVQDSALREAQEESGRPEVRFFPYERLFPALSLDRPLPFDLDIHLIPARKADAAHYHFDVRFLCQLDPQLPFVISEESQDLRWLSLRDAQNLTDERSMQRQFYKLQALRERMFPV